jgi:hypothetical protein
MFRFALITSLVAKAPSPLRLRGHGSRFDEAVVSVGPGCSTSATRCRRIPRAPTTPWSLPPARSVPRDARKSHRAMHFQQSTEATTNDKRSGTDSSSELHRRPRSSRPGGCPVVRRLPAR